MIFFVSFLLISSAIAAESPTSSPAGTDTSSPSVSTTLSSKKPTQNSINQPVPTKTPFTTFYANYPAPHQQAPPQQPLIHYIGKPIFTTNHPRTMLIIAQPALVPQHLLYSQAQQLLNYFHNNPQAKHQLLYGNANRLQPVAAPVQQQQQAVANYQVLPPIHQNYPQQHQNYHQYVVGRLANYGQPSYQQQNLHNYQQANYLVPGSNNHQYTQIPASAATYVPRTQVAGAAGSHYSSVGPQTFTTSADPATASPVKTAPPIITGLENFSPEQQTQIKEQLAQYFGGNLRQIDGNSLQAHPGYTRKFRVEVQQQQPLQQQQDDYSQQIDNNVAAFSPSNYYRPQYTKKFN